MATYGKLVRRYSYNNDGNNGGLMNRTILVYETKTLFKVQVWDSSTKGWASGKNRPLRETTYKKMHGYSIPEELGIIINTKKDYKVNETIVL